MEHQNPEPAPQPRPEAKDTVNFTDARRRQLLGMAGTLAGASLVPLSAGAERAALAESALADARDEDFWASVAEHYDRTEDIINLEHGYWGRLARPVQERYLAATREVNARGAWYARKGYGDDHREAVHRVATLLGAAEDEIALTRNATEAVHNLVRQFRHFAPADEVLFADVDYPAFKRLMGDLHTWRGVKPVEIVLPSRATAEELLTCYVRAFEAHPKLRLMLLTHASNQHGLVLPVRAIAQEARRRGIYVICDAAQSWGLVDLHIDELGADWVAFNLHKWIGAPLGLGALYMRRGTLDAVAPYPGEVDGGNNRIHTRIHTGTSNFAAVLAIPAALDFHESIGGQRKEARLRYLRSLWTDAADRMPHIEVLGGAEERAWSGMGAFRLRGESSPEAVRKLQRHLEETYGIFTVARVGLASGACIRVTPQVFTQPHELQRLTAALAQLTA